MSVYHLCYSTVFSQGEIQKIGDDGVTVSSSETMHTVYFGVCSLVGAFKIFVHSSGAEHSHPELQTEPHQPPYFSSLRQIVKNLSKHSWCCPGATFKAILPLVSYFPDFPATFRTSTFATTGISSGFICTAERPSGKRLCTIF